MALLSLPVRLVLISSVALGAIVPAATAQTTPAPAAPASGDTIRLSDEERMRILDNNTIDSAAAARGEMTEAQRSDLRIHGEVGVMVGTNGSRGIFGVADIPLGDNAHATVMFENSRFNYRRR